MEERTKDQSASYLLFQKYMENVSVHNFQITLIIYPLNSNWVLEKVILVHSIAST